MRETYYGKDLYNSADFTEDMQIKITRSEFDECTMCSIESELKNQRIKELSLRIEKNIEIRTLIDKSFKTTFTAKGVKSKDIKLSKVSVTDINVIYIYCREILLEMNCSEVEIFDIITSYLKVPNESLQSFYAKLTPKIKDKLLISLNIFNEII